MATRASRLGRRSGPHRGRVVLTKEMDCILDSAHDATKSSQLFDAQALADAFCVNKTITEVLLGNNKFGDDGLKARDSAAGCRGAVEQWNSAGKQSR